jgi:hypothetical protein
MADIPDCHCGALLQSALVGVQEAFNPPIALSRYTVEEALAGDCAGSKKASAKGWATVDPTSATKMAVTASKFTWDFPYRFLASIGAITTGVCWWTKEADRPIDVLTRASRWAGIDITRHAKEVNDWLTTLSRLDVIALTARLILLFSLFIMLALAYQHTPPTTARSAATLLLAETILAQLYGPPDLLNWSYFFWFWAPLAISLVCVRHRQWRVAVGISIFDLVLSAVYAVLIPLLWCTTSPGLARDLRVQPARPSGVVADH